MRKQAAVYSISRAIFACNNKTTKEVYYQLMNPGVDTDGPTHILDDLYQDPCQVLVWKPSTKFNWLYLKECMAAPERC